MPAVSLIKPRRFFLDLCKRTVGEHISLLWGCIPRSIYLNKLISKLNVAFTRICNIKCCFCPYSYIDDPFRSNMEDTIFNRLTECIANASIRSVMLSPDLGEPFLVSDLLDKIEKLRLCGVDKIEVTTNATLFHIFGVKNILERGPDIINISFPGFDKQMYERICGRQFYDQTRSNIIELLRTNAMLGKPRSINLWLRGDGGADVLLACPEIAEFGQLADDICMMTQVDDWLGLVKQEALPPGLKIQTEKTRLTRRPCAILYDLTVHPDGNIHLCSCRNIVRDPCLQIGNIMEIDLDQAFSMIDPVLSKWEQGIIPSICYHCSMYCDPAMAFTGRVRKTLSSAIRSKPR